MHQGLLGLLALYTYLHNNKNQTLKQLWNKIMTDKNHHIIVAQVKNKIVSSYALIIVPNLTYKQRSLSLVEER